MSGNLHRNRAGGGGCALCRVILLRMRILLPVAAALAALLAACGPEPRPAAPAAEKKAAAVPRPPDETASLPRTNLVDSAVVEDHLMGKSFMPGGTVGRYRKGKQEYEVFVRKLASPLDAALLLPDWQKALARAKLVPAYGAYYGDDNGRPVFVFGKGPWIAGIAGLPEKDVDPVARVLANGLK